MASIRNRQNTYNEAKAMAAGSRGYGKDRIVNVHDEVGEAKGKKKEEKPYLAEI